MLRGGSRTARTSAAQRAFHTIRGAQPKVLIDELALDLAGPPWNWLIGLRATSRILEKAMRWTTPMIGLHVARARYVEERLDQLLEEGPLQYVLLGAGMDSFGLRRPDLAGRITIYEIDHPRTQESKRNALRRLGHSEPPHVVYVPVDFERESLEQALIRAHFSGETPTLFAWMGVIPYLTEESILATLRDIAANSVSGSELVFDTLDRAAFSEGRHTTNGRKFFRYAEKRGEPMITGLDPHEAEEMLTSSGFERIEIFTSEALKTLWFQNRDDGLAPWEYAYIVRARVR